MYVVHQKTAENSHKLPFYRLENTLKGSLKVNKAGTEHEIFLNDWSVRIWWIDDNNSSYTLFLTAICLRGWKPVRGCYNDV